MYCTPRQGQFMTSRERRRQSLLRYLLRWLLLPLGNPTHSHLAEFRISQQRHPRPSVAFDFATLNPFTDFSLTNFASYSRIFRIQMKLQIEYKITL